MNSLLFLYLRSTLHWGDDKYTFFYTAESAISAVSLLFVAPLLSRFTRITDLPVVILGLISSLIRCFAIGLATNDWPIYLSLVPIIRINQQWNSTRFLGLVNLVFTAIGGSYFFAYMSKQVDESEHGKPNPMYWSANRFGLFETKYRRYTRGMHVTAYL